MQLANVDPTSNKPSLSSVNVSTTVCVLSSQCSLLHFLTDDNFTPFRQLPFPLKLHEMLSQEFDNEDIVSWLPHGKAFRVHNPKEFAAMIMPRYFRQSKYKSFQRQLHIYGFKRIRSEKMFDFGAYYHEKFLRGQKTTCLTMTRQTIKGGKTTEHLPDPDFYKETGTNHNIQIQPITMPTVPFTFSQDQEHDRSIPVEVSSSGAIFSSRKQRRSEIKPASLSIEPIVPPLSDDPLPATEYPSSDEEDVDAMWFFEANPEFFFGSKETGRQFRKLSFSPKTVFDFDITDGQPECNQYSEHDGGLDGWNTTTRFVEVQQNVKLARTA